MFENDPKFLKTLIKCCEICALHFDSHTKPTTSYWKHTDSLLSKEIQLTKLHRMCHDDCLFYYKDISYHHVVPGKTTLNAEYCISVLKIWRQDSFMSC